MALPSGILPWIEARFCDANGDPLAYGTITTYYAGTATPKATYTDTARAVAHTNPIVLDAAGRPPGPVFLAAGGYLFSVADANSVVQYTADNLQDVGMTWLASWGEAVTDGSRDVTSGYTVDDDDYLVTVLSTGGPNPCLINLPTAAARLTPVAIKNLGTVPVQVTPNGSDTIDGMSSVTLVAATATNHPTVWLASDGTAWYIVASHAPEAAAAPGAETLSYVMLADSTAAFTLTNATATALSWNTEVSDVDDLHSTSTFPSRVLTVPVGVSGVYHITAQATFLCSDWPGARRNWLALRLNGASGNIVAKQDLPFIGNNYSDVVLQVSASLLLTEYDYIEVVVYSNLSASPTPTGSIKGGGTSADYYTWVTVAQITSD